MDGTIEKIELESGKYTLLHHSKHGGLTVLRYGGHWRNETGDKLMLSMFYEIQRLREFYNYFSELYGQGLEVANWHMNGDLEPFDDFFDDAEQEMNK